MICPCRTSTYKGRCFAFKCRFRLKGRTHPSCQRRRSLHLLSQPGDSHRLLMLVDNSCSMVRDPGSGDKSTRHLLKSHYEHQEITECIRRVQHQGKQPFAWILPRTAGAQNPCGSLQVMLLARDARLQTIIGAPSVTKPCRSGIR